MRQPASRWGRSNALQNHDRQRNAFRFKIDAARHQPLNITGDYRRSRAERIVLAASALAAVTSISLAIAWTNWATVHCAAILSGFLVVLCCAPWVEDCEGAAESSLQNRAGVSAAHPPRHDVQPRRAA